MHSSTDGMIPVTRALMNILLDVLSIKVEAGRLERSRSTRDERFCEYCTLANFEDQAHFLLGFPIYNTILRLLQDHCKIQFILLKRPQRFHWSFVKLCTKCGRVV